MPGDLDVHLNRDGPHSIAVGPQRFEADGPFDVVLRNHGAALHVHLHLDDDLSQRATLGTTNHYVDEGSTRRVRVTVDDTPTPTEGRLKLVTGYGAETAYVNIALEEDLTEERHVRVDESLGTPRKDQPSTSRFEAADLPVLGLGILAMVIAVAAVGFIGGAEAALGSIVILVGLAVAIALLRG